MPNWVEQDLEIVGPKPDLDLFLKKTLLVPKSVAERERYGGPMFRFARACRPSKRERPNLVCDADAFVHFRTDIQCFVAFSTAWDYPRWLYRALAKQWPTLSFVCAVNEDMGQFGGVIVGLEGKCIDEVRDYRPDYRRSEHGRAIRPLLTMWRRVIRRGRRWTVTISKPWKHAAYDADATFNDEGFFYFRTEAEARAFAKTYRGKLVPRRTRSSSS
jgi:hypothetical protein